MNIWSDGYTSYTDHYLLYPCVEMSYCTHKYMHKTIMYKLKIKILKYGF
jgi:hypothetical protein